MHSQRNSHKALSLSLSLSLSLYLTLRHVHTVTYAFSTELYLTLRHVRIILKNKKQVLRRWMNKATALYFTLWRMGIVLNLKRIPSLQEAGSRQVDAKVCINLI